jgi:hypothetical protein
MLARLPAFVASTKTSAKEQKDIFEVHSFRRYDGCSLYLSQCLGVYQALCEIAKNSPSDVISRFIPEFFEAARSLELNSTLCNNALIRKLRIKLLSRAALRLLPAAPRVSLRKGQES